MKNALFFIVIIIRSGFNICLAFNGLTSANILLVTDLCKQFMSIAYTCGMRCPK